ncbi:MAG: 3'-5' exonuclease [Acidimicrobiales bacterium]
MNHDVIEAQSFWDCVMSMRRDDSYLGNLMETLAELRSQPFQNPKLQTHDVGTARNGKKVYSSDVGGRRSDRRLIWQLFNNTIVVLLYGTHAVLDRAKRMRIDFDPNDRVVTVFEQTSDASDERPYHLERQSIGKLFMAWTDAELAELGFPEPTVAVMRGVNTDSELLDLEGSMDAAHFEMAFNLVAFGNASGEEAARAEREALPEPTPADKPEVTDEDRELELQLTDPRAGAWFTRTEPEFLREVMSKPIEDWMIFLHPDQRTIVTRNFEGPAQVRGSAGTGKTVVGLHRAAWLAERNREAGEQKPLLFTTFIKSLPPVFEALYLRLPGTRAGEVEFVHIDRLASQICTAADDRLVTAPKEIDAAFEAAYRRHVYPGTPLGEAGFTKQYVRDEITAVIKGRAISSLDEYLEIRRTGRKAPMGSQQRSHVWQVMEEWDADMARRGTVDFPDVVLRARDHARNLPQARYSGVVVDEAQDLSLAGLQLIRALANAPDLVDRANGLLLLGDGAQRIYTGGFTLRQAGLEVRGRSSVLRTNYRNTRQILSAAMAVAGEAEVDDLGETFRRGEAPVDALRSASAPLLIEAASFDDQLSYLAESVGKLVDHDTFATGDIGILVPTNRMVSQVVARLSSERIPAQDLAKYDGQPSDLVKVGTYHRAKGLEFKAVFLPGLSDGTFPREADPGQPVEEATEAEELALSQLFVAMTRARDLLVALYNGKPSSALASHLDVFERVEA